MTKLRFIIINNSFKNSIIAIAIISVFGCSAITPNSEILLQKAKVSDEVKWSYQQDSAIPATSITELVNLPELNSLVQRALNTSPNLHQTAIALKIAYAQYNVVSSQKLPSIDAGFGVNKTKDSNTAYTTDINVSWELDLWQKIADNSSASIKDIASNRAIFQGAKDALAANIMRSWLDINLQQQLLNIESKRLAVLENNQGLVLERYHAGLGSLEDLDNANTKSSSTKATIVSYQEQLAQSKRNLTLLLGELSNDNLTPNEQQFLLKADAKFPDVILPLAGLPKQDLARRPDLQSAYLNIEAETLRANVAYKAMLPSISLSASLTEIAESPSESLLKSPVWSLLGQLSAPIFQGGKLKAQAEIADLTAEQYYWAYQETLLNAVNEVENSLGNEKSFMLQEAHLANAFSSAKRSFTSYQEKYRNGLVDIIDLLTIQQQTYDIEAQLTQIKYNRLVNRIDLGLALGLGVSS